MKKVLSLICLYFFIACSTNPATTNAGGTDIDNGGGTGGGGGGTTNPNAAPAFTLDAYPSGKISLKDYQGKVVYLFFVGYNCPPCIASAPSTQSEIAEKYDTSKLQVLALDVWDGGTGDVANFQIQTGIKYPVLMKASTVGTAYNATNDYSVLVDQNGDIAYSAYGVNITALKEKINQLLGE